MVVDDDRLVRRSIVRVLNAGGWAVTEFEDGKSALERFRQDPNAFDVFLVDQTMPIMPGDEVIRSIRMTRPTAPVILFTGMIRTDEGLPPGVRILGKPATPDELLAAVGETANAGK